MLDWGVTCKKYPNYPHSLDTWRMKIIQRIEAKEAILGSNGGIHYLEIIEGGTRLVMPKTIYVPSTSLLKTGLGATEGVLD